MQSGLHRWIARAALAAALLMVRLPPAAGQGRGAIEGWVSDERDGRPLSGVRVSVMGDGPRVETDGLGVYRLRNLPPGRVQVRLELVGYAVSVEQVDVVAGEAAIGDFTLAPIRTVLETIQITGPPGRERQAEGASVGQVTRGELTRSTSAKTSDFLRSRVPGVLVIGGGQVGAGTRLLIRGINSVSLSTDPLVYVDGIRVSTHDPMPPRSRTRGQTILDIIDPASIDHIEVLRGPAAAGLYGDGSANGVILIYTKHGGGSVPD